MADRLKVAFAPWGQFDESLAGNLAKLFVSCRYRAGEEGGEWNKGFCLRRTYHRTSCEPSWSLAGALWLAGAGDSLVLQAPINPFRKLASGNPALDQAVRQYVSWLLQRKPNRLTSFQRLNALLSFP